MTTLSVQAGEPKPFTISIPEPQLESLKTQVEAVNLEGFYANLLSDAEELDENDYRFGIPPVVLRRLIDHLKTKFDWRREEKRLNDMGEHFKVDVNDLPDGTISMHFIVRSCVTDKNAPTVMLIHGWPGSFAEFDKMSAILCKKYNLVIPSLPGYTFSKGIKESVKGRNTPWSATKTALCCDAIMQSLGIEKYAVQGGDWGSMIARRLAILFPERVRAVHVNFINGYTYDIDQQISAAKTENELRGVERAKDFDKWGCGYGIMQGTVPYTLGAVLASSPIALLAHIGEKFYRWSAPDSHPSPDEIITDVLLYWFTQSITSSFWLYQHRVSQGDETENEKRKIKQPMAFACGYHEIEWAPEKVVRTSCENLISYKVLQEGGHFLALEKPELLAGEVEEFMQRKEVQEALR